MAIKPILSSFNHYIFSSPEHNILNRSFQGGDVSVVHHA